MAFQNRSLRSLCGICVLLSCLVPLLETCESPAPTQALPSSEKTHLLLVTLDTLRADYINGYGRSTARTPSLDRLAREGILWQTAESTVPITLPSHATIFTGLYPFQHGVRNNGFYHLEERFTTLAEILKDFGFDTAAFIGGFPLEAKFGLDQGFSVYDDRLKRAGESVFSHPERPAAEVVDSFLSWHRSRRQEGRFFAWLHFYDPHAEYEPPEPYGRAAGGTL